MAGSASALKSDVLEFATVARKRTISNWVCGRVINDRYGWIVLKNSGEGQHRRAIIDIGRFMGRLAAKAAG